ncbi:hypothetical protein CPC08DRAFT_708120 [Agrocybe pediades]|nr:hypothetical protein CPC08DRAFT_708120 [Agrocybe pediades]
MTVDNPENAKVQLTVTFEGQAVKFNTKRQKPLAKVFSTFCERINKDENTLRFYFNGNRVRPEQTPDELDLEDDEENEIVAFLGQQGGA